jgi:hypothetical protein
LSHPFPRYYTHCSFLLKFFILNITEILLAACRAIINQSIMKNQSCSFTSISVVAINRHSHW